MVKKKKRAKSHDDREHAPLPPSASKRWYACPGSMGYIKKLIALKVIKKRESGPAAQRGTRIHEIAEAMLRYELLGRRHKPPLKKGHDKDEWAEAEAYVAYCLKRWYEALDLDAKATFGIETKSTFTEENWGSVDFWIFAAKRLTTIDLKSGREGVLAEGNTQLINYLAGIARTIPWPREFEAVIWQPNADDGLPAERSHVYTIPQFGRRLKEHEVAVEKATEYLDADANHEKALVAGDHCGWCDAYGVCPRAKEYNMSISQKNFTPVPVERFTPPPPATLEADQVGEILKRAPAFVNWLEAVQVRALELMNKGHRVPGHKVVQKITRRAWQSGLSDAAIARKLGLAVADVTKTVRLSPAEVEKKLDKKRKDRIEALVFKPQGEPVVVPETDRRAPLLATKINFTPVKAGDEDDG